MTVATTEQPAEKVITRGHKKKARTRRALLDAALDVLAEHGEGFSIADIATRAGVAHGTFYNYFADRDALIDAVVTTSSQASQHDRRWRWPTTTPRSGSPASPPGHWQPQ